MTPRYRIYEWEWDMQNGEYTYRDYYGEEIEVKDEDELWEIIDRRLREIVEEAEKNGWSCEDVNGIMDSPSIICTKPCEEGVGEDLDNPCVYEHEIGYDIEEISS